VGEKEFWGKVQQELQRAELQSFYKFALNQFPETNAIVLRYFCRKIWRQNWRFDSSWFIQEIHRNMGTKEKRRK
jgi:hypothetical protein